MLRNSSSFFAEKPKDGNTLLHLAIQKYKTVSQLDEYLSGLSEWEASVQARTVNDDGKLPYDLVASKKLIGKASIEIKDRLIPLMMQSELKSLHSKVTISRDDREKAKTIPGLLTNLEIGCEIANEVRKFFWDSSTHPQANAYSIKKYVDLCKEIKKLRDETQRRTHYHPEPKDEKDLQVYTDVMQEHHVGNCREFAYRGYKLLKEKYPDLEVAAYAIENSDHKFLIIGLKKGKFTKQTVLVDSWSGSVYPVSEHQLKLKGYIAKKIGPDEEKDYINVITNYNPDLHSLSLECRIEEPARKRRRLAS